jgi:flagellar biogenesis protein FliO
VSGAGAMRLRWHLIILILAVFPMLGTAAETAAPSATPAKGQAAVANQPSDGIPPEPEVSSFPRSALGDEGVRSQPEPAIGPGAPAPSVQPGGMDYPRVLGALAIVIGLIFVLRWIGRSIFPAVSGKGASRAIEVLSRSPLSPKQQVVLLRVGRRLVVVGDTGGQMNALCEISDPDEVAALVGQIRDEKSTAMMGGAFGTMFRRSRKGFEDADVSTEPATSDLQDDEEIAPVTSARQELSGLRERVRLLSEQFKDS